MIYVANICKWINPSFYILLLGQGGFYGSGGSRISSSAPTHHPEATARMADIAELKQLMESIQLLESELFSLGSVVNSRTVSYIILYIIILQHIFDFILYLTIEL